MLVKVAVIVALIATLVGGLWYGFHRHDNVVTKHATAVANVVTQQPIVDATAKTMKHTGELLDSVVKLARRPVKIPDPLPPIAHTEADTSVLHAAIVARDAQIDTLRTTIDTLQRRVSAVITGAELYKSDAIAAYAALVQQNKNLQDVIDTPLPRRHWGFGLSFGPGAYVDKENNVKLSKGTVNGGVTYSL